LYFSVASIVCFYFAFEELAEGVVAPVGELLFVAAVPFEDPEAT